MFMHSSLEDHGFRFWWHTSGRSVFRVEMAFLRSFCGASIRTHDREWTLHVALPWLAALWVTFDGFGLWHPQRKCIASWEPEQREFWIPDDRECDLSISGWTLRFTPWGRSMEWNSRDPWWIRGLKFDIQRFVLGRRVYVAEELALVPCHVPMPEGFYPAVAKVQRVTRGFTRWFKHTGQEVTLDIPKGIPYAGKGENSWDCGDDGLFGIGGDSIEDAIRRARESALESRRRHGHASPQAVREALQA
jgi:hypothetical protein